MTDTPAIERESMEYDVVIVGAGPSGLSAAIRLKQIDPELSVVVLEAHRTAPCLPESGSLKGEPHAKAEITPPIGPSLANVVFRLVRENRADYASEAACRAIAREAWLFVRQPACGARRPDGMRVSAARRSGKRGEGPDPGI